MTKTYETKMAHAKDVYARMTAKVPADRVKIIEAFIAEVKLTKAGAATYFWKIHKNASQSA